MHKFTWNIFVHTCPPYLHYLSIFLCSFRIYFNSRNSLLSQWLWSFYKYYFSRPKNKHQTSHTSAAETCWKILNNCSAGMPDCAHGSIWTKKGSHQFAKKGLDDVQELQDWSSRCLHSISHSKWFLINHPCISNGLSTHSAHLIQLYSQGVGGHRKNDI